jgi:hypothetical protein
MPLLSTLADIADNPTCRHLSPMTLSPPAFTWNDIVETVEEAPQPLRPGSRAWIVGISAPHDRSGSFLAEHPTGYVYTIEFEDGSSVSAPETLLRRDSGVR